MSKIWVEKLEAIPNVQYTSTDLNTTHDDVTLDIEKLDEFAHYCLQKMHVRRMIKSAVVAIAGSDYSTWGSLTANQQKIAAKWCVAPYSLRVPAQYSDSEDLDNWNNVVRFNQGWAFPENVKGRAYVIEIMREHTSNQLRIDNWTYDDSNDFLNTVIDFMMTYIFGEDQRLIQWITNEVGSPYETNGFAQKTYFSAALRDELVDIYNGYY